jgi:succinate-semialdehyde dehydrogenase/glutarate-semialdehyde dehydrogenase
VASIATWSDDVELVARVNEPEYGPAGYVYAGELGRAIRISEALDVGMVGVNRGPVSDPSAPFAASSRAGWAAKAPASTSRRST